MIFADTSVLINFLHLDRLDLLVRLAGYEFCVSEHVVAEVTRNEQRRALKRALAAGWLKEERITESAEIRRFIDLHDGEKLGAGEAASLALAESRGGYVACDERRKFKPLAEASIGRDRLLTTASLIVMAIQAGLLTVPEADVLKRKLEAKRFRICVKSFADLLPKG